MGSVQVELSGSRMFKEIERIEVRTSASSDFLTHTGRLTLHLIQLHQNAESNSYVSSCTEIYSNTVLITHVRMLYTVFDLQ